MVRRLFWNFYQSLTRSDRATDIQIFNATLQQRQGHSLMFRFVA